MTPRFTTLVIALVVSGAGAAAGSQSVEQQGTRIPELGITLPAGWQLLFRDGCHYAVPRSWLVGPGDTSARAPDGTAAITVASVALISWAGYKDEVRSDLRPWKIHEDSESRFWSEFRTATSIIQVVAVRNGSIACTGHLEVRQPMESATEAVTQRILESIAPGTIVLPQLPADSPSPVLAAPRP